MRPSIFFPGKYDPVPGAPDELIVGNHSVIDASSPRVGAPDLAPDAGSGIRDANGPRRTAAVRRERENLLTTRHADERHLFSIGRPDRKTIAIDAGIQIANRLCGRV